MVDNQDNRPRQQPLAEQMTKAQIKALRRLVPRTNEQRRGVIMSERDKIWQPHGDAEPGAPLEFEDVTDILLAEENAKGFTIAAQRDQQGNLIRPPKSDGGFAVAFGGTEVKRETGGGDASAIWDVLQEWFYYLEELFVILGVCFGGWRNKDGGFEFNISLVFKNQRDAELFAMAYDQEEIFDVARGDTIDTGGEGTTSWIRPGSYQRLGLVQRPGSENGVSTWPHPPTTII